MLFLTSAPIKQPINSLFLVYKIHRSKISTQILSEPNHFNSSRTQEKTSKYLIYCNSQITRNGRNGNLKASESVFNRMPHKNTISWTAMLTAYAENGQIVNARKMFDKMPERNIPSYNAMITAYNRKSMVDEAFLLFSSMKECNAVSYAAMITGFVRVGRFDLAEKLYGGMPVKWRGTVCSNVLMKGYLKVRRIDEAVRVFEGMEEKDVVSCSSMIDGYCKTGRISDARNLFDQVAERNVVTWTSMIDGYMKMGNFENGFELLRRMRREGVEANSTTLTVLFEGCGNFKRYAEGIQIHGLVLCLGFDNFDIFLGNSMIAMYSRCDCIDAAAKVFQLLEKKDVVTWNSLIGGYVQSGKMEEAFILFENMPQKDIVSWTTIISGLSTSGMMEKAIELFHMMPEKDDDIAWTALISGFVNNEEYEEALHWFIVMLQERIAPNPLTLSSVLSASSNLANLGQGSQVHGFVIKMDMENDLSVQNSLASMYSKCGNVADAYRIFNCIKAPNIVSFNSMIVGLAQNGLGHEALEFFAKMRDEDQTRPNGITFLGVLSACVHAGLVEEGWKYLKLMKSLYDIDPGPDHYACMVDLLGRTGFLDEAVCLIQSLPFKPHSGIWGAILSASRTHFRRDIAELAAEQLIQLEPNNVTPYLVLSGLDSILGEKMDDDKMRVTNFPRAVKKNPGCSWIVVKERVHVFLSGDQSHIDVQEIKAVLCFMANCSMEMHQSSFFENFLADYLSRPLIYSWRL